MSSIQIFNETIIFILRENEHLQQYKNKKKINKIAIKIAETKTKIEK